MLLLLLRLSRLFGSSLLLAGEAIDFDIIGLISVNFHMERFRAEFHHGFVVDDLHVLAVRVYLWWTLLQFLHINWSHLIDVDVSLVLSCHFLRS